MLFLIALCVIVCLFNFYDVPVQRGFGYTSDELLILARSYMSVSEDPATGTNQKAFLDQGSYPVQQECCQGQ